MKTVQEKLAQIAQQTGFPFAISDNGYDLEENRYDGIEAWPCRKDAEGAGVEIVVFLSQEDCDDYDANVKLWNEVDAAAFCEIDGEAFYF